MAFQTVAFERRKLRRCKPEISAFVSFKNAGSSWMCKLLDISLAGLAFSCSPCGNRLLHSRRLSIIIPNPVFYLEHMAFGLISDSELDRESADGFATRRCGVEFRDLDSRQNSSLKCLIETLLALPWGFSFTDHPVMRQQAIAGAC
jgi:hypothetical protein